MSADKNTKTTFIPITVWQTDKLLPEPFSNRLGKPQPNKAGGIMHIVGLQEAIEIPPPFPQSRPPPAFSRRDEAGDWESTSINIQNKNPICAFLEYAAQQRVSARLEVIEQRESAHEVRFIAIAIFASLRIPGDWERRKRDAKYVAAEKALNLLLGHKAYRPNPKKSLATSEDGGGEDCIQTEHDFVAGLVHNHFRNLNVNLPKSATIGRKILAAFVMEKDDENSRCVVSLGTGNRCISGDLLSKLGLVVNDSHAEVVSRRGFVRFLYHQLLKYVRNPSESIFELREGNTKLSVKPGISFHLYISTAPCGDAAMFSRTDSHHSVPNEMVAGKHFPVMNLNNEGILRTKLENGEGSVPAHSTREPMTWDGVMRGDQRLRTMSCSDKIARWNVLGVQGGLLTHFVQPIYLSSVTIGCLYNHGHLSRALCCRLEGGTTDIRAYLPEGYSLQHPTLGKLAGLSGICRDPDKTNHFSVNWNSGDGNDVEVVDGSNGVLFSDKEEDKQNEVSRISKLGLLHLFKKTCLALNREDLIQYKTYKELKNASTDYATAKNVLYEYFLKNDLGRWIGKPPEEKQFDPWATNFTPLIELQEQEQ